MKYRKLTEHNTKEILIIHGWAHSSSVYEALAQDLGENYDFNCTLVDLAGFGDTEVLYKSNIIQQYAENLYEHLKENTYDKIFAHSLGGLIVLKALDKRDIGPTQVILANPVYSNITKARPVARARGLNRDLFNLHLKMPAQITEPIVKKICAFSVNDKIHINEAMLTAVRQSNSEVLFNLLYEMAHNKWRAQSICRAHHITILHSELDRLVTDYNIKALMQDLKSAQLVKIPNIGHTTIVEAYPTVIKYITD